MQILHETSGSAPYLTPISRALATAPQNFICFAPLIRVPLNDVWFFELEEVSSRPPLPKAAKKPLRTLRLSALAFARPADFPMGRRRPQGAVTRLCVKNFETKNLQFHSPTPTPYSNYCVLTPDYCVLTPDS